MRLWHFKLIPYLPQSQLISQWRELNSIFKKQNKHVLINYIYNYDKASMFLYTANVIMEMNKRGIKLKSTENMEKYFSGFGGGFSTMFSEHDDEYLTICYWNLKEKFLRGQKDFTKEIWEKLDKFYKKEIKVDNYAI